MSRRTTFAVALALTSATAAAAPPSRAEQDRGETLYTTYCIACHTTQVHWRDKHLARDWAGLKAQVTRWQTNIGLGWPEADIDAVARYLNGLYYRFPPAGDELGLAMTGTSRERF